MNCDAHPKRPSVSACRSCGRELCAPCAETRVDGLPWCSACVTLLDKPTHVLGYLGAASVGIVCVIALHRVFPLGGLVGCAFAVGTVLAAAVFSYLRAERRRKGRHIHRATTTPSGPPYRPTSRRLSAVLAPAVSGRLTALTVGCAMALTAAAVPTLLRLPRWVELEIIVAGWWAIWMVTYTFLLFHGFRIADERAGL